jgi:hypothetical protein
MHARRNNGASRKQRRFARAATTAQAANNGASRQPAARAATTARAANDGDLQAPQTTQIARAGRCRRGARRRLHAPPPIPHNRARMIVRFVRLVGSLVLALVLLSAMAVKAQAGDAGCGGQRVA